MGDSTAFDIACSYLERSTGLERPAARGTVRLALKEAGLDPDTVTADQLAVVTEKVLPAELRALRISDVEGHCQSLRAHLKRLAQAGAEPAAGPEAVFERLADS
jgi:hypothetical protein